VGEPEARVEAELDEVGGEAGVRRGDAEVGHHRQAEARADGRALHGGDDRLLRREQPHGLLVERIDRAQAAGAFAAHQVGAGAEVLALGLQHRAAQLDLGVDRVERVGEIAHELHGDVVVRRPVDRHHRHVAVGGHPHMFAEGFSHRLVPRRLRATTHLWISVGPS
jgi:hypothetical protein